MNVLKFYVGVVNREHLLSSEQLLVLTCAGHKILYFSLVISIIRAMDSWTIGYILSLIL